MSNHQNEYVPKRPAESAKIRSYAETKLNELRASPELIRDKTAFTLWLNALTNEIIGTPTTTKKETKVSEPTSSSSSANNKPQQFQRSISADMREPSLLSLDKLKLLRNDVAAASGYSAPNYEDDDRRRKQFDNPLEKSQQSKLSSQNEYPSERTVYPDMRYASEVASSRTDDNATVPLQKLVSFRETIGSDSNSEGSSVNESDSSFEDDINNDENEEGDDENDEYNNEMIRSDTEKYRDLQFTKKLVSAPHAIDVNIPEVENRKNMNISAKEYKDMNEIQTPSAVNIDAHSEVNDTNSDLKMSASEPFEYEKLLSYPKTSVQKEQIPSDLEILTMINTKQGLNNGPDNRNKAVEPTIQLRNTSELLQTATLSLKMNQRKKHEDVNDDIKLTPTENIKDIPKFYDRNNHSDNERNNDNNYDYNKRYSEDYNNSDMNDNHKNDDDKRYNDSDNHNYSSNNHNNDNKRSNNYDNYNSNDTNNIKTSDDNVFSIHYTLQDELMEKNILLLKKNNIEKSKIMNFENEYNVENETRKNRGGGNSNNDRCIGNNDKVDGEIDFSGSWRSLTNFNDNDDNNLSYKSHGSIDNNINKQNNLNFSIDKFSYENFDKHSSIQPSKYESSDVNDIHFNLRRPTISSSVPIDNNKDNLYPRNLRESVDLSDITFQKLKEITGHY